MKRPLVPVALFYAGGIVLGEWLQLPLAALFAISLVLGLAALGWKLGRVYLLCALLIAAGWTNWSGTRRRFRPTICGSCWETSRKT